MVLQEDMVERDISFLPFFMEMYNYDNYSQDFIVEKNGTKMLA